MLHSLNLVRSKKGLRDRRANDQGRGRMKEQYSAVYHAIKYDGHLPKPLPDVLSFLHSSV